MFGYLQIEKSELKLKDFEKYRAVYCSLCRKIGRDYSIFARLFLSYDCTFFALLLLSQNGECTGFEKKRCTCNPLKKCTYCIKGDKAFESAAALSVITVYYKLCDDINDSKFFKKLLCKMILPFAKRQKNKAAVKFKELDAIVFNMLKSQQEAEKDLNCCIDKACEPTAVMLSSILKLYSSGFESKIFEQLGYYLGRWIYLCDAVEDLSDDIKKNCFNPLKNRAGDKQYFEQMLNQVRFQLNLAYNLYEPLQFKEILDNLFIFGLETVQNNVINKSDGLEKAGDDI